MLKIIFFPFIFVWWLLGLILKITGKVITGVIGLICIILGIVFLVTLVGSIFGIPLILFGVSVFIRSFFKVF